MTGEARIIPGQRDLVENFIALDLTIPDGKGARRPIATLLDVGVGSGYAARRLAQAGLRVSATGFDVAARLEDADALREAVAVHEDVDVCDMARFADGAFDAVWCAHVLEHVFDLGRALAEIQRVLAPDGWLCLSLPPAKTRVVGGHVTAGWTLGQMMYVLAAAGFDLSDGRFVRHGYNLCALVRRGASPATLFPGRTLRFAAGDIETLARLGRFPPGFGAVQGYEGDFAAWNWVWRAAPESPVADPAPPPPPRPPAAPAAPLAVAVFVPWITQGRGGTEHVGAAMANVMAARGWRVTIHTFDDRDRPSAWPLDPAIALVRHPETVTADLEVRLLAALSAERPDLLVGLHMNRTFLTYVWCARRIGVPIVLSEHIDPAVPRAAGLFDPDERVAAFAGAERIHLLHDAFRATLPDFLQERVRVTPNTVDRARRLADPANGRGDPPTVLAVARLIARKNLDALIEAFAFALGRAPGWRLRIVGYGPERAALERRAAALGLRDAVEFAGRLEDPYPAYEQARLFALPSRAEGFPMTVLEAMTHGLPTVGYADCAGLNAQVVDGETGLLARRDGAADGLGAALARLMEDAPLRARMGAAARERFEARYAPERVHDAWAAMFAEAAAAGPAHTPPGAAERARCALQALLDAGPAALAARRAGVGS